MISFWAAAKSLHISVKAGVLEAICLEQTWPLSLISELSASIFLSVPELYCTCFSPSVSLKFFLFCSSLLLPLFSPYTTSLLFICHSSFPPPPVLSLQAARANESSQAQLKALSQQTAATRRELDEILGRLAQREEELHSKDVELSDNRQRQSSLEQEIQEVWGLNIYK